MIEDSMTRADVVKVWNDRQLAIISAALDAPEFVALMVRVNEAISDPVYSATLQTLSGAAKEIVGSQGDRIKAVVQVLATMKQIARLGWVVPQ